MTPTEYEKIIAEIPKEWQAVFTYGYATALKDIQQKYLELASKVALVNTAPEGKA